MYSVVDEGRKGGRASTGQPQPPGRRTENDRHGSGRGTKRPVFLTAARLLRLTATRKNF